VPEPDIILNLYKVLAHEIVYSFHRCDVPPGEMVKRIDIYKIPLHWWDDYLSKNMPQLYLGASYVDRRVSRVMGKKHIQDY
jgi:hypothetical protein